MTAEHHVLLGEVLEADAELLAYFGLNFVSATDEGVTLAAVPRPEMINALGLAHGSFLFTLADTAAAYALAARGLLGPTINANVSFTGRLEAGVEATAFAQVTTSGRTLATVSCTVTSNDRIVGHGTFQCFLTTSQTP